MTDAVFLDARSKANILRLESPSSCKYIPDTFIPKQRSKSRSTDSINININITYVLVAGKVSSSASIKFRKMEWLDNGSVVNLDATGSPISLKSVLDNSSNYNSSFSSNALDNCSDSCGWVAAMIALVAYGSYAVPIKQTQSIEVHPLVFQSYKSLMMLLLAPPVTMFLGLAPIFQQPITLYWGILSGGLWVLGGTMGVLAVRLAGMSRAVAVWASVIVMVREKIVWCVYTGL